MKGGPPPEKSKMRTRLLPKSEADCFRFSGISKSLSSLYWHRVCYQATMMDVALSLLAFIAGGVTIELFTAARAPLGYQDERGFHLGTKAGDKTEDCQSGNPS